MSRGRAFRKRQLRKKKRQARDLWASWGPGEKPTGKWVGVMASTHCRPCSCIMCAGWHDAKEKTRADKKTELRLREELDDLWEDMAAHRQHLNSLQERLRVDRLWIESCRERIAETQAELDKAEAESWPFTPHDCWA